MKKQISRITTVKKKLKIIQLNKPRPSVYNVKPENINKLRNAIDTMFLDGECGILRNNEIIINDEEVEYDGGAMEKRGVPKQMDILKEQIMILQARNDELEQKDLQKTQELEDLK